MKITHKHIRIGLKKKNIIDSSKRKRKLMRNFQIEIFFSTRKMQIFDFENKGYYILTFY